MPLVCHEFTLVISVHHYDSSLPMLCTFWPIALIEEIAFKRDAVAESISLPCAFTPLTFEIVAVRQSLHRDEFALMEFREGYWTVVVWRQTLMQLYDWLLDLSSLHIVEIHRHVYYGLAWLENVHGSHWVAVVQELLEWFNFMVVFRDLFLELLNHLDELLSLFVADHSFCVFATFTDDWQLAVARLTTDALLRVVESSLDLFVCIAWSVLNRLASILVSAVIKACKGVTTG